MGSGSTLAIFMCIPDMTCELCYRVRVALYFGIVHGDFLALLFGWDDGFPLVLSIQRGGVRWCTVVHPVVVSSIQFSNSPVWSPCRVIVLLLRYKVPFTFGCFLSMCSYFLVL